MIFLILIPWTRLSECASKAEVASSRIRIFGFRTRARAMTILCRWPPDNKTPLSPISVSFLDFCIVQKRGTCPICVSRFYRFFNKLCYKRRRIKKNHLLHLKSDPKPFSNFSMNSIAFALWHAAIISSSDKLFVAPYWILYLKY